MGGKEESNLLLISHDTVSCFQMYMRKCVLASPPIDTNNSWIVCINTSGLLWGETSLCLDTANNFPVTFFLPIFV